MLPRFQCLIAFLLLTNVPHGMQQAMAQRDDGGIAGVIGTGFNYQGVLKQSGVPFNGQAEFAFSLWDAPTGGNFIADSIPPSQYVDVVDGQFNAMIDFGPTAFLANEPRYMVVAVRVPPGTGSFTGLAPRQSITPTPWALYALNGAGLTLPYVATTSAHATLIELTNTHPGGGGLYGKGNIYGVFGQTDATAGVGTKGQHSMSGNYGELGTPSVGAQGVVQTPDGTGVVGTHVPSNNVGRLATNDVGASGAAATSTSTGVIGTHLPTGNFGRIGTASHGVYARAGTLDIADIAVEGYSASWGTSGRLGTLDAGVVGMLAGSRNTAKLGTFDNCVVAVLDIYKGDANAPAAIHSTCALDYGFSAYFAGVFGSKNYFERPVGIGTQSPAFQLQLSTNSAAKPTSNTWTIASDERLKKDINTIAHALDDLLALRGVTYRWKDPASQGGMDGTYTGMIAQEVEKVFPEWVSEDAEGTKHLTVIGFEGLVIEALRELRSEKDTQLVEQKQQLDAQQTELTALNEQIATLQAQVDALITTTKEHQQ